MASATVRRLPDAADGPRWGVVFRFPPETPAELSMGRRGRTISLLSEELARNWANTLTSHGIIDGYRMYLLWLHGDQPAATAATIGGGTRNRDAPAFRSPANEPGNSMPVAAPSNKQLGQRGRMRVREAMARMLDYKKLRHEGAESYRSDLARDSCMYIEPFFGELYCDELSGQRIAQWQYDLIHGVIPRQHENDADVDELEPLSISRIKNIYTPLKQMTLWAIANSAETGLNGDPCIPLRFPDSAREPREAIFLTPEHLEQLVKVIRPEYRNLITCGVGLGMRWGEFAALRVEHLVIANGVIRIKVVKAVKHRGKSEAGPKNREKGKRWVQVDADGPIGRILLEQLVGKTPSDYVFTGPRGKRLSNAHFHSRGWIPAMDILQRDYTWTIRPRFHDLRHTSASFMLEAGHDLFRVAKVLGHSLMVCDEVYGHLSDRAGLEATRSIAEVIAKLFSPSPAPDGDGLLLKIQGEVLNGDTSEDLNVIDLQAMRLRLRPA